MYQKIKLGQHEVDMVANAATAIRYRQVFQEDLLAYFASGDEDDARSIYVVQQLAYIMSEQAAKKDFTTANVETYVEWLEQFEQMAFITVSKDIIKLFLANEKTLSTPKKKAAQLKES